MGRQSKFSGEVRERAVRLVFEQTAAHGSEWSAIKSVAEKLGCTPETLRKWPSRRNARHTLSAP